MARYTSSFILSRSIDDLPPLLINLLQDCELDVQYYTTDYIMAREIPGNVSFAKLVTVEVLLDKSSASATETRMSILVKNEELQSELDHCRQMFEYVKKSIEHSRYWDVIEVLAGWYSLISK